MNSTIKLTIAAIAAPALAAIALASPAGASTHAVPSAVRSHVQPCPVSQLHGSLSGGLAATGAHRFTLTITNDGSACTISGYPRLRERTGAGTLAYPVTIHGPVLGVPDAGPATIRLAKGQKVTAAIGYGDDGATGATVVSKLYAGFKGQAGWVPVAIPDGPVDVYENAVSTTAWR